MRLIIAFSPLYIFIISKSLKPETFVKSSFKFEINKNSYDVYKNKVKCNVSTREFEVLWYLMSNAGIVLTKEQIFSSVWGSDYGEIGTVAVHIKSLRSKIDPEEKYIVTIWGVGYKFVKELENE